MNADRIRQYAADPAEFRSDLLIQSAAGVCRFGDCMAPCQRKDFDALDPALFALARGQKPETTRFWIERTKGGSKDSDVTTCLLWLMTFANRPLRIQVGAYDAQQADEIRLIAQQILRLDGPLNRLLATVFDVQRNRIVNTQTGSAAEILTTDAYGSHGSRPDLTLVNELSHIGSKAFAETLMDNADKCPGSLVIIATNSGHLGTWQHDWHNLAKHTARWYFSTMTAPSPSISEADLAESRLRNSRSRYARLWQGQWVRPQGDALTEADIQRALTLREPITCPTLHARGGFGYTIGLDLSTRRDHSAMVLLECDAHARRVRVVDCQSWTPGENGVDLIAIKSAVKHAAERYQATVHYDPFQAALMQQQLALEGVRCIEAPFTPKNLDLMASALLQAFREGRIDLYHDAALVDDLQRLCIEEKSFGYKLTASHDPEKGHCDRAFALAIALPTALEFAMSYRFEMPEQYTGTFTGESHVEETWILG